MKSLKEIDIIFSSIRKSIESISEEECKRHYLQLPKLIQERINDYALDLLYSNDECAIFGIDYYVPSIHKARYVHILLDRFFHHNIN